jgi:light-regulated signal transduction histidine kinase (bacteriophytochrome)
MVLGSVRYCTEHRTAYSAGVQLFSSWESLTEDMLAREAAELARSNAELQQFAYAVSHDLNEHIRMITSYLQLLESRYRSRLDSDADEFINYSVQAALRMRKMLADLLAYSKATRGGMERKRTDCEAVLQRALRRLHDALERSGATINHDPLPTLMANPPQMLQLLENLIENALTFRREVPPAIHISAREEPREWIFSVRDNGIGIEPAYLERIFNVFERLHTKAEYPGTGLGLATCKMIVERHGGRIWAESQPGTGSVFNFSIPKDSWESS